MRPRLVIGQNGDGNRDVAKTLGLYAGQICRDVERSECQRRAAASGQQHGQQILGEEADGLDYAPYPGELGQRIYDSVSKQAWQRWLAHQTMLINEYRLTPIEPEARKFLETEMDKFFFGEGSAAPKEFVPQGD